jgi:hypothetical protein
MSNQQVSSNDLITDLVARQKENVGKWVHSPSNKKGNQSEKYNVGLSGEYYVAAELCRHGVTASVTLGSAKNVDIIALAPEGNRYARIEVKSTWLQPGGGGKWPTGRHSIDEARICPDTFWVLVLIPRPGDITPPRFFVFTSEELINTTLGVVTEHEAKFLAKNGKAFDRATGVPNLTLKQIESSNAEGAWGKILGRLGMDAPVTPTPVAKTADLQIQTDSTVATGGAKRQRKIGRLTFVAKSIEPLKADGLFEIQTSEGTFRLTKTEFYEVFRNVVESDSYRLNGVYSYKQMPRKALRFLVDGL